MSETFEETFSFKATDLYKKVNGEYESSEVATALEMVLNGFLKGVKQLSYERLVLDFDESNEIGLDNCSAWDEDGTPCLVICLEPGLEIYASLCTVTFKREGEHAAIIIEQEG